MLLWYISGSFNVFYVKPCHVIFYLLYISEKSFPFSSFYLIKFNHLRLWINTSSGIEMLTIWETTSWESGQNLCSAFKVTKKEWILPKRNFEHSLLLFWGEEVKSLVEIPRELPSMCLWLHCLALYLNVGIQAKSSSENINRSSALSLQWTSVLHQRESCMFDS